MANFNLSIDLSKFWGARVTTTKSGQEVIVIPIDENFFTKGRNGGVFASLQATERAQVGQYNDTHYIKPRFKKDTFAQLSEEQRNSIPFVGTVYAQNNYPSSGGGQNNPNAYTPTVSARDIDDSIF